MTRKKSDLNSLSDKMAKEDEERRLSETVAPKSDLSGNILPDHFRRAIKNVLDFHRATSVRGREED